MSNRAVLYLRSSKDRSDVSIDAQRRALHELAGTRNLIVVDEYADAVESGKDDDRPAFQRLIADLKAPARSWEWVLALDTSRVARRRTLALLFEQECSRRKVRIVYRNIPDTDPITEMLLKSILQAMDEWHSLTSKTKGLAGMAENVRQGWRAGGRAPRGYALEYHATGAIRDGAPVMKSKLVVSEDAELVRAYLQLRAKGVSRGQCVERLQLPWPATSTHSMDWQAMTYAGHTVWNVHAERQGGGTAEGEKRRPRAEWMVQRGTHEALITDAEAEAILAQMERAQQGRRLRASPLLLTGLLVAPGGAPWHSDGCGAYRLGKGKKVAATRIEPPVLERIAAELTADATVERVLDAIRAIDEEPLDGRRIAGLERRLGALTTQIGRTVDLCGRVEDATPILRRVEELEAARSRLVDELAGLRARQETQRGLSTITAADVRRTLGAVLREGMEAGQDDDRRARLRQALAGVVERIELDPATLGCQVHFRLELTPGGTGDKLASRRGSELSPVRWNSSVSLLPRWARRAA